MSLIDSDLARQFDRLPPHSIETEKALLGALMRLDGDLAKWTKVRALLCQDSFFEAGHGIIFAVIDHLIAGGADANVVAVREALKSRQLLDDVGGQEYVAEIYLSAPHAANAVHDAKALRQLAMRRGLISLGHDAARRAYAPADEDDGAEAIALDLAARAARLATTGRPFDVHRLGDVAAEVFEAKAEKRQPRIPTGLRDLDWLIGGLRKGGKVIVGGKAGMGKSLLLKHIGLNLARRGVNFGIVSVEESRIKVTENALANVTGVINNRISFGELGDDDARAFIQGVAHVSALPFFIVDAARRLRDIIAAAHALHFDHGCDVIAVDHLHIIDGETDANREREVSKISAELKWCWKDLNVAGLEAAQLNRGSGKDRPSLASLRDSGSLEQDADVVILLHREDYYRTTSAPDHIVELIVAKNKDGAPGVVPLVYDGARQHVSDYGPGDAQPDQSEDPP